MQCHRCHDPGMQERTGLCSCLSLLQQGNETMADRLLVLVPHEHTHAPRSILEQARNWVLGPDVTEMRAIKHTMELIAHSLCIANGAPAKVAREGRPGKMALLNGQSMGTKSELHQSPELTDAHWQLIVGLKSQITRPAKPSADLLMKPRLSRAPIPEKEMKGEPIPRSLNCLVNTRSPIGAHQWLPGICNVVLGERLDAGCPQAKATTGA